MKKLGWYVVAMVAVASCGDNQGSTPDANTADAPPSRTVTGIVNQRFITPSGVVEMPVNLSGIPLAALVGADFTQRLGATRPDGTFSIPNVPVGNYYLKLGNRFIDASADTIDLSVAIIGRPTSEPATSATVLTLNAVELAPWAATDEIQMFSPETGTAAYAMESDATAGAPSIDDTSLTDFSYDLRFASRPALIDGSKGDRLTVTQLATQTDGTRSYRTAARKFAPGSFTVSSGGTASLTGSFTTVASTATLEVVWNRPAFDAELVAHSPQTFGTTWSTLAVSALPAAATHGFYASAPDALVFAPGYTTDKSIVTTSWPYSDPFPAEWTRILWIRYFRYRIVDAGGASSARVLERLQSYRELSTGGAQAPLEPTLGQVVDPQINGMSAFRTLAGIGTTPTVSWTAPTLGTSSRYYVAVIRVYAQNGATKLETVATVETSRTQVTIPPGVLSPGLTYLFEISARATPVNLDATPFARGLPEAWSAVSSQLATP